MLVAFATTLVVCTFLFRRTRASKEIPHEAESAAIVRPVEENREHKAEREDSNNSVNESSIKGKAQPPQDQTEEKKESKEANESKQPKELQETKGLLCYGVASSVIIVCSSRKV